MEEPVKRQRKKYYLGGALLLAVGMIFFTVFVISSGTSSILSTYSEQVDFPVYEASEILESYKYDETSFQVKNDVLFYKINSGSSEISVSQQALPDSPPDVVNREGVSEVKVSNGRASSGLVNGRPVGLLLTNTTLISIYASSDTPIDIVNQMLTDFRPV